MEEHYNHQENFNQIDNNEECHQKGDGVVCKMDNGNIHLTRFTLAAAMAWVDLVRNLIKTFITVRSDASLAHFIFAVVLTILAVIVYMVIKNYLAEDLKEVPIIGVIK